MYLCVLTRDPSPDPLGICFYVILCADQQASVCFGVGRRGACILGTDVLVDQRSKCMLHCSVDLKASVLVGV